MKRQLVLPLLILVASAPVGCGQVSTSPDGGGQGGRAGGTAGSAGATGAGGMSGSAGSQAAGNDGSAGTTGAAGTSGIAGTTGGAGRGGATGNAGTTGAAGTGGTTGASGATGTAGNTGAGGSAAGTGGGTCTYEGVTYPVGTSFPSSDGCNSCSCTGGGLIACTLRACPPDAGAAACLFDTTYRYGDIGGKVIYQDRTTLAPPAAYQHTRDPIQTDPPSHSCAPALPPCNSSAIDVSDVMRDIADADVQSALAMATPPVFGRDARPVDGSIFSFLRNDGRGFLAGGACSGTAGCTEIPAGVTRLVATLRALDEQQLKDASCAALR